METLIREGFGYTEVELWDASAPQPAPKAPVEEQIILAFGGRSVCLRGIDPMVKTHSIDLADYPAATHVVIHTTPDRREVAVYAHDSILHSKSTRGAVYIFPRRQTREVSHILGVPVQGRTRNGRVMI